MNWKTYAKHFLNSWIDWIVRLLSCMMLVMVMLLMFVI